MAKQDAAWGEEFLRSLEAGIEQFRELNRVASKALFVPPEPKGIEHAERLALSGAITDPSKRR